MTDQSEIAARLVKAREAKGMSGAQLARKLGMSQQKYHPYEHEREMKSSMITQVCAILECSPSWLLGMDDEGMHLPKESELLKALKAESKKIDSQNEYSYDDSPLSSDERKLLNYYRKLTKKGKRAVLACLKDFAEQ